METFALIVFGGLAVLLLAVIALGAWNPSSIAELTGRSDQRRWATQAEIEARDVGQMVDAHNVSRRRRGKREVTGAEIRDRANAAQQQSIGRAESRREAD
jgi:hypothetical protein